MQILRENHTRSVPHTECSSDSCHHTDTARYSRLQLARPQRHLDGRQADFPKTLLLVLLLRESFDDANRGENLLRLGNNFALLLAHGPRSLFYPMAVLVNEDEH